MKKEYFIFSYLLILFLASCTSPIQEEQNSAPTAIAGEDVHVRIQNQADLDASASTDTDGDTLSYLWEIISAPAGNAASIISSSSMITSLTPDAPGEYVIGLTVGDGKEESNDEVSVFVYDIGENMPPVADAGEDYETYIYSYQYINASGSYDPDGDGLLYSWEFVSIPDDSFLPMTQIMGIHSEYAYFYPYTKGNYQIKLTVSDGILTDTDEIIITLANKMPFVIIRKTDPVLVGELAVLDGHFSGDGDQDPITFSWKFEDLPSESNLNNTDLINSTTGIVSFYPDVIGLYKLALTVSDGIYNSTGSGFIEAVSGDDGYIDILIY